MSESVHLISDTCVTTTMHSVHPILYLSTFCTKKCAKSFDACLPTEVKSSPTIHISQREALQSAEKRLGQWTWMRLTSSTLLKMMRRLIIFIVITVCPALAWPS